MHQSYKPQHFNQFEHPVALFGRSSLDSIPLAQPGMPVIPLPFTLLPWPIESQISMGFDFEHSQKQQEIRQQRIENIMNLGKPKPILIPRDRVLYPQDNLSNSRFAMLGQQQLNNTSQYQQANYPAQSYSNYSGQQQQLSNSQQPGQQFNYYQLQSYLKQQQQQYPSQQQSQYFQNQQLLPQPQQQKPSDLQLKQSLGNLLLSTQSDNKQKEKKDEVINDKKLKEDFQNSFIRSKNLDNRSSDHSSKQLMPKKFRKKLPVSSKRFRIFKASIIFISYYVKTLNSEISKKITACRERDTQIPDVLEFILGQYEEAVETQMIDLLNNKIDFSFVKGKEKDNKAKIEKIYPLLIKFLTSASKVKQETLNPIFYEFLKSICIQGQFPPLDYFIQYEIERIRFNTLGQIGKISESLQLMIIEGLFLIRIIVFQLFFKAWEYHPDQDNQEILFFIHRNSLILGSILSYIFLERYHNEIQLKFNWEQVNWNKIKIIPQLFDDEPDLNQKTFIKNLLPQQAIAPYLQYLQQDARRYGQLNDLLTSIAQIYLQQLKKHIESTKKVVEEKPRMISLIMNTIFREMYISKKPRRQQSN